MNDAVREGAAEIKEVAVGDEIEAGVMAYSRFPSRRRCRVTGVGRFDIGSVAGQQYATGHFVTVAGSWSKQRRFLIRPWRALPVSEPTP